MKAQELFERVQTEMANGKSYEEAWHMVNAGTSEGAMKGWEHRLRFSKYGDGVTEATKGTHVTEWENEDLGLPELRLKHAAYKEGNEHSLADEVNRHIVKKGGKLKG